MFQDPLAVVHAHPVHPASEKREILIGHSNDGNLLLVASQIARVEFASSALALARGVYVETMKKVSKKRRKPSDDLEREYSFDYSKARPNPYAARLKGGSIAVVLDPDVASVFRSSEEVNTLLRSVVAAVPRRSAKTAVRKGHRKKR